MEIFYSDKTKKFECVLDIDGASLNETKARLSLSFNNDKTKTKYVFEGMVSSDGNCTVKIPELKYAPNDSDSGNAILEIIAENTYFEPWTDTFIIKKHKNVVVKKINEEIEEDDDNITVKVIKENTPEEIKPIIVEEIIKPKEEIIKNKVLPIKQQNTFIKEESETINLENITNKNNISLNSKEFQTKFIMDIVNNIQNENVFKNVSSKSLDYTQGKLSKHHKEIIIELVIDITYRYNNSDYDFIIKLSGDKINNNVDYDNFEFDVSSNDQNIDFDWVRKNKKLFTTIIKKLVTPFL
jgi:hypothetical protein